MAVSTPNARCLSDWVQQLDLECLLRHSSRPRLIGNIRRAENTSFSSPPGVALLRPAWSWRQSPGSGVFTAMTGCRRTMASKSRFLSDCRSADVNTHCGSYGFSLSLFLPRTGLTAQKTSQHHLDVAVDGFIPVRPANNNH